MTSSYNSSLLPKIIFFHGLNNNVQSFEPLMTFFQNQGYETHMVVLPCHGDNRTEARTFLEAQELFDERLNQLTDGPWMGIAFSHGALYLQRWIEKHPTKRPLKQILLAPALSINRQKIISFCLGLMPSFFLIKSLSPKRFRRYESLNVREYNILVKGILHYQRTWSEFPIPTLIMIDPKDELVDAKALKKKFPAVEFFERRYLKMGLGSHHILFHPDYFSATDWKTLIQKMSSFLKMSER